MPDTDPLPAVELVVVLTLMADGSMFGAEFTGNVDCTMDRDVFQVPRPGLTVSADRIARLHPGALSELFDRPS